MGRAVKLKRQRKRQQKQQQPSLNPLQFPSVFNLSEREIEQEFSALIDWLLEQWSQVPQLVEDFTLSEARQIAHKALRLLFDAVAQKPPQDVSIEWKISPRFTIHIFFSPDPPSIDTLVLDTIDKQVFDLTGEFIL